MVRTTKVGLARRCRRSRGGRIAAVAAVAVLSGSIAAACGGPSNSSANATSAGTTKSLQTVTLEYPSPTASGALPIFVGLKEGIYKKYGITLKAEQLHPPLAVDSILSGKLDFMTAVGTAGSAAIDGKPIRIVQTYNIHPSFVIMGAKGVTSIQDVKGKVMAGESAGGQANLVESLVLQHFGIPLSDVSIVNVGAADAGRFALLKSGKAAAAAVDDSFALRYASQGYPILAVPTKLGIALGAQAGLATSLSFAKAHKNLVANMIAATVTAVKFIRSHKSATVQVMEKQGSLSASVASAYYDFLRSGFITTIQPSENSIQQQLAAWKLQLTLAQLPKAGPVFDWTFVAAAKKAEK